MIKRFHYFQHEPSFSENHNNNIKNDNTSLSSSSTSNPTLSSSSSSLQGIDLFKISYRTSKTQPSIKLQVPASFTILQDHQKPPPPLQEESAKGNKIKVLLLGSDLVPDLSSFIQISPSIPVVDRIEFHGSIRYEKPPFAIIHQLQQLRKVKFFLGSRQRAEFFEWTKDDDDDNRRQFENRSITSFAIIVSKKLTRKLTQGDGDQQLSGFLLIERMVIRILIRASLYFPSIRKLTVEAPNSLRIHEAVFEAMSNLKYLKDMVVEISEDGEQIIVVKAPLDYTGNAAAQEDKEADNPDLIDDIVPAMEKPFMHSNEFVEDEIHDKTHNVQIDEDDAPTSLQIQDDEIIEIGENVKEFMDALVSSVEAEVEKNEKLKESYLDSEENLRNKTEETLHGSLITEEDDNQKDDNNVILGKLLESMLGIGGSSILGVDNNAAAAANNDNNGRDNNDAISEIFSKINYKIN